MDNPEQWFRLFDEGTAEDFQTVRWPLRAHPIRMVSCCPNGILSKFPKSKGNPAGPISAKPKIAENRATDVSTYLGDADGVGL